MPKLNTTVKSVRIDNEKLADLEKKLGGRSINSWLNEQIVEYLGGKPQTETVCTPSHAMSEIDSMAKCMHIETDDLLNGIYEGLNDGKLSYEKGKVVGYPDFDIEPFKEACHDAGIDPQSAMDKVIGAIRKGKI